MSGHEEMMRNTNAAIRNIEQHMAELSKIVEERLTGSFPGNTEVNHKVSLKAITLRSGKQLRSPTEKDPEIKIVEPQSSAR